MNDHEVMIAEMAMMEYDKLVTEKLTEMLLPVEEAVKKQKEKISEQKETILRLEAEIHSMKNDTAERFYASQRRQELLHAENSFVRPKGENEPKKFMCPVCNCVIQPVQQQF